MIRFLLVFIFLFSAFEAMAQTHTVNPKLLYQSAYWTLPGRFFDSGTEPCVINGDKQNAISGTWYYKNGRHAGAGTTDCIYDLVLRSNPATTIPNWTGGNWLGKFKDCPLSYPHNGTLDMCVRASTYISVKPCRQCDEEGNPIATGSGAKIERTQDTLSASLSLKRTFRSENIFNGMHINNLIGSGWHSDLTKKIVLMTANATQPASAMLMRPDGTAMIFNKNGSGDWVPEDDLVRYTLEEVVVSGVTTYVFTPPGNQQEIYNSDGFITTDISGGRIVASYVRNANGRLTGIEDINGRKATVAYTVNGLIDTLTLQDGQVIDYDYDSSNRLTKVTHSSDVTDYSYTTVSGGTATYLSGVTRNTVAYSTFTYDSYARANSTQHAGGVDHYGVVYSSSGNTATVTTPSGATKVYQFNVAFGTRIPASWQLSGTGITTAGINFAYDAYSNAKSKKGDKLLVCDYYDTSGRYKIASYDFAVATLATCPATETLAAAATFLRFTTMQWDAVLNVATERKTYNAASTLEARTTYAYNSRSQLTAACQIDPGNGTAMSYTCGASTNAPTGVRQSTTTYCESGDITSGTCPILGLPISTNGPRTDVTDVTTLTYYQTDDSTCVSAPTTCPHRKGDLWKVTNALSQVTEYTAYDGAGRVLQMKNADNVVTDMEYAARGWLTARKVRGTNNATDADDNITTLTYDANGQVTKVTQPDGDYIEFTYNAAHRLTKINDAANNSITYTLDNAGNRTAEVTKDPSNNVKRSLSRTYDILDRLKTNKNAASTTIATMAYDANDNLDTVTDGLSRVTDQDVDPLNRLIQTIQDKGVSKINATTQFEYDARDNLTKVIDPKALNTVYTYNGLNDLSQLVSPDTGTTTYTYDDAGNRLTQTDAKSVVANYEYDELNRLTEVNYTGASGLTSTYVYDTVNGACSGTESFAKGRLTQLTDASGDTQYCYDRFGNITRKRITNNGVTTTLLFTYTKSGRLESITYPSGMVATYTRNSLGQITQVDVTQGATTTTVVNAVSYLPFGPLKSVSFPVPAGGSAGSTLTQTRTYDSDYAIDSIGGLDYSVDVQGNITSMIDGSGGNVFQYDNIDRLKKVRDSTNTTDVLAFTYDATGNRLSKKVGAGSTVNNTYGGSDHRLTAVGAVSRTLDANGNTTQAASNQYFTYDERNRMVDFRTASGSGTRVSQYEYNGKGERVRKYLGGTDQARYIFSDGGSLLVEEKIIGGVTTTQEILWLDDMPIGVSQNGTLHGILVDQLNSPRQVFELGSQTIVWNWSLFDDAFGENIANEDPDANSTLFKFDMRFPGQLYDVESGLHYNYFRDYDAANGRYVESDPIGLDGGISTFTYVTENPLVSVDFLGLSGSRPGGPYHPPINFKTKCKPSDTCSTALGKMWVLARMITSHQGWDWSNPKPRGGSRHVTEIPDLYKQYAECWVFAVKKCGQACKKFTLPRGPISAPPLININPEYSPEMLELRRQWGEQAGPPIS